MESFLQVIFIGVIATIAIDAWAIILNKGFNISTANWGMIGRWFGHLPSGKFIHNPISSSSPIKHEHVIGWTLHYAIGVAYTYLYLLMVSIFLGGEPSLLSATLFGLSTVIVPWFVLQPGLGFGVFSRLAKNPMASRALSLSIHTIFGVALYIGWLAL